MELWIRSQDKSDLSNVKRVTYYFYNGEHHIFAEDLKVILGIYATKERALEILDEIQNLLHPKTIIKVNSDMQSNVIKYLLEEFKNYSPVAIKDDMIKIETLGSFVYNMPEE